METPICDFVRSYAEKGDLRLHMPGHKGSGALGIEALDITEISGADSLYEAAGIIRQSEENASRLFGCPTYYSTEGSSQCIRAMLYLCTLGISHPLIAAGRNVHKSFVSAAALLDLEVAWLYPEEQGSYLSCHITADSLDRQLSAMERKPAAVYLTSPDYLGNMADIQALAEVCHHHGCLLAVDNAHGAYLRFLPESRHPMDLGADLCCDSAHKTLPVLTGGAYLHIASCLSERFRVKDALALFGSTSPSYLILQSLDQANLYLSEVFPAALREFLPEMQALKDNLHHGGYILAGDEPMKITLCPKLRGYTGTELSEILESKGIVSEFADPDYLVLMPGTETDLIAVARALLSVPAKPPVESRPPMMHRPRRLMSIREAVFSPAKTLPAEEAVGQVLAAATVGCPPAVPIVVSGEGIDEGVLACLRYYGIAECTVVEKNCCNSEKICYNEN